MAALDPRAVETGTRRNFPLRLTIAELLYLAAARSPTTTNGAQNAGWAS
jgi:hypothetical protein